MYIFQSNGRTQDLQVVIGGVKKTIIFSNFRYSTSNEEEAAAIRKNIPQCGIFDLTPQEGKTVEAPETAQVKTARGARMSGTMEQKENKE